MKKNKKKLPELIFPVFAIGLLFLGFYISSFLDLPGAYLCSERVGMCAIPFLGKVIGGLSSPSFWFAIIFYVITFGGSLYTIHKKGYRI